VKRLCPADRRLNLARACVEGGYRAQCLPNTINNLRSEGIHDRNLWRIQALVAQEILKLETASPKAASLA
jgi:cation transport protein ChaC